MESNKRSFGLLPDGTEAELFTLRASGIEVDISNFGATIVAVRTPDRNGTWADIVLGFDSAKEYLEAPGNIGATIGRFAGRIANARFPLNGKQVQLEKNRGKHSIHGGPVGFHHRIWSVTTFSNDILELSLFSPDGDQGFPGAVQVTLRFTAEPNTLTLEYTAKALDDTICSMTQHTYWNLAGHNSGEINGQFLLVPGEGYLEVDQETIPTGTIFSVGDGDTDLRNGRPLSELFLDRVYLLPEADGLQLAGRAWDPNSGRCLEVLSNMPCSQIYTSDHLPTMVKGKSGAVYGPHHGFCIETQGCPDAPNHQNFPQVTLRAGAVYQQKTVWIFGLC